MEAERERRREEGRNEKGLGNRQPRQKGEPHQLTHSSGPYSVLGAPSLPSRATKETAEYSVGVGPVLELKRPPFFYSLLACLLSKFQDPPQNLLHCFPVPGTA